MLLLWGSLSRVHEEVFQQQQWANMVRLRSSQPDEGLDKTDMARIGVSSTLLGPCPKGVGPGVAFGIGHWLQGFDTGLAARCSRQLELQRRAADKKYRSGSSFVPRSPSTASVLVSAGASGSKWRMLRHNATQLQSWTPDLFVSDLRNDL